MSKFYQHVEPGDNLGKITRLKYIDDISDDELILYCFEDGTKCSSEYIGGVNETEDSIKSKVMVELTGPDNPWQFMKKEVIAETSKKVRDEVTGEIYEVVGRDVEMDGAPGGQNRSIKGMAKNGIRIEITQPRKLNRFRQEEDGLYKLSEHPELEKGEKAIEKPVSRPVKVEQKQVIEQDETVEIKTPDVEKAVKIEHANFLVREVNADKTHMFINTDVCKKLNLKYGGEEIEISIDELYELIKNKDKKVKEVKKEVEVEFNEDPLIKNMIDKSKKKVCGISMNLKLELPPKEVYETIKMVYPEGMTDEFVKSLTARIPVQSLKESLSTGLSVYYDGAKKPAEKKEKNIGFPDVIRPAEK